MKKNPREGREGDKWNKLSWKAYHKCFYVEVFTATFYPDFFFFFLENLYKWRIMREAELSSDLLRVGQDIIHVCPYIYMQVIPNTQYKYFVVT